MTPSLSIVIVTHNTWSELDRCLTSLHAAPPQMPYDIVVVDNGSTAPRRVEVTVRFPGVRVIETGANRGFAAGNNIGIRATAGELILLLNSDTEVPCGALDALVAQIGQWRDCAILGPRIVDPDGRLEISFGRMMSPWNELAQRAFGTLYARRHSWAERRVARLAAEAREVEWVSGACLLVRRTDAVAAGLLDERYFLYGEDVDFCAAIRALGRTVRFTPAAEVVHLRGRARVAAPIASARAYRESHLAFYAKHHPRWLPWLRLYLRMRSQLPDQIH